MTHCRMLWKAGRVPNRSGLSWRAMACMLSKRGGSYAREKGRKNVLHAASPSIGRTLTMRIMPACMW